MPMQTDIKDATSNFEAARLANAQQMLCRAVSTAQTTREWAPLAASLDKLVADEVFRESCGAAVSSAKDLLETLQAEEKENRVAVVSIEICVQYFCQC